MRLEANIEADRSALKDREMQLKNLESERDDLRDQLNDERLKMSQGGGELEEAMKLLEAKNERLENIKAGADSRLQKLEAEKDKLKAELEIHRKNDEIEVSESKKVRLESDPELQDLLQRIEILENENKMLKTDLRLTREKKVLLDKKLDKLQGEKLSLEHEFVKEKTRRNFTGEILTASTINVATETRDKDMSASVAVVPESSSRDAATSPEPNRRDIASHFKDKLTRSTTNLIQQARISISSCNPGDVILVLWDPHHRNYILLQESSTLYFLHSDCVDTLDLGVNSDGTPKRMYAVAEVIDKEYCHAKKVRSKILFLTIKFKKRRKKKQQQQIVRIFLFLIIYFHKFFNFYFKVDKFLLIFISKRNPSCISIQYIQICNFVYHIISITNFF